MSKQADISPQEARAELRRRRSVGSFAEFVREYNKGHVRNLMEYEHVPTLVGVAKRVCRGYIDRLLVLMPPRYFKALADDTPIATPDGWCNIGDLEVGDEVFAPDGTTTVVTARRRWTDRPCYRVNSDDGHSIVADAQHEWPVRLCRKRPDVYKNHETEWLYERQDRIKDFRRPAIPEYEALELPEANLPVGPYTLGVWLGDGSNYSGRATSAIEDQPFVRARIEKEGYVTTDHTEERDFGILKLTSALKECDLLDNKRIPEEYFRASIQQRKALLQGLIDTDGTVSAEAYGQVTFVSTRKRLAKDVLSLVHTLGIKASLTEYEAELDGKDCGPKWYVTFHYEEAASLPRKRTDCHNGTRSPNRYIDFEKVENRDTVCISVAHESSRFLAGRALFVTHNSETFSRLLPAYYLHRYPRRNVGLSSYSASLAWDLSDSAREYYREAGGETATDTDAKRQWANSHGGEMWAEGVGGSLTGRGYDLGIIDDPIKPENARSAAKIRGFRSWFRSTWHNRMEPRAQMIVVMQRLSEQDPVDYLFRREVGEDVDEAPEHWHVLCLDELKSDEPLAEYDGPKGLPETCTLIEDDRDLSEPLAPSRFPMGEVNNRQRGAGDEADAQRQQRPSAPSGDFWQENWFEVFGDPSNAPREDLPEGARGHGKDWDTAYTEDERNSASAYTASAYTDEEDGRHFWFYGCDWRWVEFPDLVSWMKRTEGPHHIEAKASGKSAAQSLDRSDVPAEEVEVQGGDKYARANGVKGLVGSDQDGATGRVHVHASIYEKLLRGEKQGLLRVQAKRLAEGEGDLDLNDVFVQALNRHSSGNTKEAFGTILSAN